MVLEVAILDVRPGRSEAFEAAFREAQRIIASMPGFRRHALERCLEHEHRYLLLVWWDRLEDHTEGFRGSPEYARWSELLHPFYDPFPEVLHYAPVEGAFELRGAAMAEPVPVLSQLNLVVRDMGASLAFYRALGLPIPEHAADPSGGHHAEVRLPNGFLLELDSPPLAAGYGAGVDPATAPPRGGSAVLGFTLPTRSAVDGRFAALVEAGYEAVRAPYDAFWGARYAVVRDPDGHPVGLTSPLDPDRTGPPPELP